MSSKLKSMDLLAKSVWIVFLFVSSVFGMKSDYQIIGYLSLFLSLYILNEGFGFQLFTKILMALVIGILVAWSGFFNSTDLEVIRPVGSKIFMNCLTMALIPLVFSSIVTGVTNLGDINKLQRIGTRTIIYYIATTIIAITIGLGLANILQPGKNLDPEVKAQFEQNLSVSCSIRSFNRTK